MTDLQTMPAAETIHWPEELDRNRDWMSRVLRSRVGDAHAVDDMLQDIAVAVLRQSSRPTEPEKVAPWLYRLTVRQAINFHRRTGRRKDCFITSDLEMESANSVSPLTWMIELERDQRVREALQSLASKDREILTLKYAQHWNYEQIAKHVGAKIKTIEYRLMRARKNLRRAILQKLDVEELSEVARG